MARIVAEQCEFSFSQVIHSTGVRRFGEAQPAGDGFRRDQDEGLLPIRPDAPSNHPEELIEMPETRARMSTLKRDDLLTQSEVLKKEASPPMKETDQHWEAKPYETNHSRIYSRTMLRSHQAMLLISRPAGVLANQWLRLGMVKFAARLADGVHETIPSRIWLLSKESEQTGGHERSSPEQVEVEPGLTEKREAKLAIDRPRDQPCDGKIADCMDSRGQQPF